MNILGIDPGTRSGWCAYDTDARRVLGSGQFDRDAYPRFDEHPLIDLIVIERPRGFGFNTRPQMVECGIVFGRIAERLDCLTTYQVESMDRLEVCKTLSAAMHGRINVRNDATAWACLKELHGGEASAKKGGALYGIKAHERAALAVAVAFALKQAKAAEVAS